MSLLSVDDQQYFKALTEASIVSKSDIDGVITYVNDNFCKVTGYTREEMLGKDHNMFRHPNTPDSIYKEMWETISKGQVWRARITNRNKDGSNFIAESTIIPLIDEDGTIIEYMAIRSDVTTTVDLQRKLFYQEHEKIEEEKINHAKESFLIIFTHELKTPLNAMINFTKYIKKQFEKPQEIDREKSLPLLDSILNNATDMLENITKILEISKLNTHKLTYTYTLFSANALVEKSLEKYDSLLKERNISVLCDLKHDSYIYSDITRVEQIFSNVFSNAIKYGNDQIVIRLSNSEHDTVLSIEDNGRGIKDKVSIFNLYTQEGGNLMQREAQGTGIGLYYVKLLCEDLHIRYTIKDKVPSSGSVFIFTFDNKKY